MQSIYLLISLIDYLEKLQEFLTANHLYFSHLLFRPLILVAICIIMSCSYNEEFQENNDNNQILSI